MPDRLHTTDTGRRRNAEPKEYVCGECLRDDALSAVVEDNADSTKCDFCGKEQPEPLAAHLDYVIEHMRECIREEYTDQPADEMPYDKEDGWLGDVFDAQDLMQEVEFDVESEDLFEHVVAAFSDQQWCRHDYFTLGPSERLRYGWEAFKTAVKHTRRFTFWSMGDGSGESEFHPDYMPVGEILAVIGDRIRNAELVKVIPKGKSIWRVRIHNADVKLSEDHELSPPPLDRARQANRMSPAGIVMFYGAEDFDTACAESVDTNRAADKKVTGAQFRSQRELRILDLVELPSMPSFFQLGSSDYRNALVFLRHFAVDLAIPVPRDGREHIDYVPTQAFTEFVRYELRDPDGAQLDGIRYLSAVNALPCYVLFCTQDECVAQPRIHGKTERWLEFDRNSVRTIDAREVPSHPHEETHSPARPLPYDPGVLPTEPPPKPGDTLSMTIEGLPPYKDTHASIRNPKHKIHVRFVALRRFAIEAMAGRACYRGAIRLDFEMRAPEFEANRSLVDYTGGIMDTLDGSHGLSFTYLPIVYEDDCQVCSGMTQLA